MGNTFCTAEAESPTFYAFAIVYNPIPSQHSENGLSEEQMEKLAYAEKKHAEALRLLSI